MISYETVSYRGARAALLACCAALMVGMIAAPAHADVHDNHRGGGHPVPPRGHPGPDYRHPGYAGGYYRPPPVVYGAPYYPPPPVVYGPGVAVNMPGVSINIP